jgi:hypothetical protein
MTAAKKPISLRFIRRTLARMKVLTRVRPEEFAKVLAPYFHPSQFTSLHDWTGDVAEFMDGRRQGRKCAKCGEYLDGRFNQCRADMRCCSPRCRQAAYRARKRALRLISTGERGGVTNDGLVTARRKAARTSRNGVQAA